MFLDTSGLLCYIDGRDARHHDAVTLFHAASTRLTHSYVLAEFIPLCMTRNMPRQTTLEFAAQLLDSAAVTVVWVDIVLHRAALEYLEQRFDKTYSLCDAVSFLLLKQWELTEALSTDRHFDQAGFRRLLAP